MRLQCDVVLSTENVHGSASTGTLRTTKCSKGFVTLGRNNVKGGSRYLLHISTRSAIKGPRIEVTPSNIRHIHQSHVAHGRLTLVFVQPPMSVMIMKCIPSHLQRFLENFLAALKGDEISISALDKVKKSDFKAALKTLRVTSDNLKAVIYPSSLETLEVVALGLESVDSRWFSLPMLSHLDLSGNCLGRASNFVKMRLISRLKNLSFLSLERNEIETIPSVFFDTLPSSLQWLNIAQNRLVRLPQSLVNVKKLKTLVLSNNLLTSLPRDMSDMNLRCLFLDNNRLPCLPYDLRNRRFEKLYFNNNPMVSPSTHITRPVLPSLSSMAFASLRRHSLKEDILPWDLKMIGDSLCMKCSCCRMWVASSLLSLCLVGVVITAFAYETDMMRLVTMRAFACKKCVERVVGFGPQSS